MAEALSPGVVRRVAALFPAGQRAEVADLLASECGSNLPSADTLGPAGVDRVRFAVLKISDGSLDRLRAAVAQAQFDWRDTLVGAAFGDDPQAHLAWSADAIDAPATGQPAERRASVGGWLLSRWASRGRVPEGWHRGCSPTTAAPGGWGGPASSCSSRPGP